MTDSRTINSVVVTASNGSIKQLEIPTGMTGKQLTKWQKANKAAVSAFIETTEEPSEDSDESD